MQRLHEVFPLLAVINAATVNSTPATSAWVDVAQYHELFGELVLGNMAAETIDFKIEQAQDGSGTGAKDLKASTQLVAHASNNDNKVLQISVDCARLDSGGGFRFARLRAVTGNTTGGPVAGTLRGHCRNQPGVETSALAEVATL
jgi:hypothetical protein